MCGALFLYISLTLLQRETSRNFLVRKFRTCSCYIYFFHRRYKIFMLFFQQKMFSLFFISLSSSSLSLFSCWASMSYPLLSLFLCLPLYVFQIRGHNNWSKLIISTLDNTDTETISAFVFIDSLVICVSQDAGGYAIFRQNNLELHLGYHTFWLSYFTLVMWSIYEIIHFWIFFYIGIPLLRTYGRTYGHEITKISRISRLPHFLRHGATLARAWSSAKKTLNILRTYPLA